MYDFILTFAHIAVKFFYTTQLFQLLVSIKYSSLYLVFLRYGIGKHIHCFFEISYSLMLFPINYLDFIPSRQMVSLFFPYMVSHNLTFQFHLLFDVPLALLCVGGLSRLCILYCSIAWDGIYIILGHVKFCWWFNSEELFSNRWASPNYCPAMI